MATASKNQDARQQRRRRSQRLLLGALAASLFVALAASFDWLPEGPAGIGTDPIVGDIAERDVKAPADLSIVDRDATAAERQSAMAAAPLIYDLDEGVARSVRASVEAAFAAAAAARGSAPARGSLAAAATAFTQALGDIQVPAKVVERIVLDQPPGVARTDLMLVLRPVLGLKLIDDRSEYERQSAGRAVEVRPLGTSSALKVRDPENELVSIERARRMIRDTATDLPERPAELRNAVIELASALVRPNLSFNLSATEDRRQAAATRVADVVISLRKGEMIVRNGDRLTARQVRVLEGIQAEQLDLRGPIEEFLGTLTVTLLVLWATWRFASASIPRFAREPKDAVFLLTGLVASVLGIKFGLFLCDAIAAHSAVAPHLPEQGLDLSYVLPVAAASMLVRMVHNAETAAIFAVVLALLAGLQVGGDVGFALYVLVGSLVAALGAGHVSQRGTLLSAGVRVGAANAAVAVSLLLLERNAAVVPILIALASGFISGCLAGGIATAVVPAIETIFGYTTDVKLLELANREQALLRELEVRAPGTYHHSMMVGHLAEKAAEAIGANPLLAKVAGYYHDIGKMRRPHFFVENITIHQGENRHEKLAPPMSARIIQAHVKDGLELGQKHRLAQEIMRGIGEHHGTSVIRFFYEKAKEQADPEKGDSVQEHDYRYAGPKPQTRESGILMLADSVEAASRTLADATPPRVQQLVQRIINNYFRDGQLDDCSLTLRDLHAIARTFIDTLCAIRHERIDYPETTDAEGRRVDEASDEGVVERLEPRARGRSDGAPTKRKDDLRRLGLP
jgi:cyclic-di-AMP phosphodiesterase PgpH